MQLDLAAPLVQSVVAEAVGVSKQAISAMLVDGALPPCRTNGELLLAYCERLREQAAGRMGSDFGGLDLVQERAGLAREQRFSQEMKNAVARSEFAPIGVLADVLGRAAGAVADRFDQVEGSLRKACPEISDEVLLTVLGVVSSSRNEWLRATAKLIDVAIDRMQEDGDQADDADGVLDSAA